MQRYDYTALHRDFIDTADFEPRQSSSGPGSVASTISSASDHVNEEYKAKYERLQESYKRLQRNNISLEEKLLNVSEKFNADKNLISRDLATQTQKVVEAKLTIQQLNKENFQLKSDLKVALQLLQNKPNAFVHQKLANLPTDLQARVRDYYRDQEREKMARSAGQRISVTVTSSGSKGDTDEAISAAILAKVLEQRERERSKDKKFCIDIGTQTHHWGFPDTNTVNASDKQRGVGGCEKSTDEEEDLEHDDINQTDEITLQHVAENHQSNIDSEPSGKAKERVMSDPADDSGGDAVKSSSSKSQSWESDFDSESSYNIEHVSNLLLASVIQTEPDRNCQGPEPLSDSTYTDKNASQPGSAVRIQNQDDVSLSSSGTMAYPGGGVGMNSNSSCPSNAASISASARNILPEGHSSNSISYIDSIPGRVEKPVPVVYKNEGWMPDYQVTEVAARLKDNGDVVLISGAVTNNNSSGIINPEVYYSTSVGLNGGIVSSDQHNSNIGVIKRSYTYDYLTSHQLESTPPYRAKPSIPSPSSVFQAIGKSSVGQHVSLTNHQMSSIEEASSTTSQQLRQTLPESSAVINPLHSSSSTDCVSLPAESVSISPTAAITSSWISTNPHSSINPLHSRTIKGLSSDSMCSSREGSLTGQQYQLSSSGRSTTTIVRNSSAMGSTSRLTRSVSYSTKQTDL